MAEGSIQADCEELERPGLLGRAIRLGLGFATLSLLSPLLTVWREGLWSGVVPLRASGFWVLVALSLWGTSYVFNMAFGLTFGQKTRTVVLLGAGLAGLVGLLGGGGFPNAVFGVYLWTWLVALAGVLGTAHVLAAALGTPGCEMRSYAHARALRAGGDVDAVVCPGGIDRLDHVGRRKREEVVDG